MPIQDNNSRYGSVSRALHWAMALVIFWQMLTACARTLLKDTPLDQFMWSTHKPLGLVLFLLIIVRIVWALMNLAHRPSSINVAAKLGHIALYGLMIAVPLLGLLRQYGSGRAFDAFGIAVFKGFEGARISWMVEPGNLLHGWLGWALLVLIIGHIFMVFWHRRSKGSVDVLPRMWR